METLPQHGGGHSYMKRTIPTVSLGQWLTVYQLTIFLRHSIPVLAESCVFGQHHEYHVPSAI